MSRALWILCAIVLAGLTVVLALQNRALRTRNRQLQREAILPQLGQVLPTARLATVQGDSVTLGQLRTPLRRQVLITFSTTCEFCRAAVPLWRELAQVAARYPEVSVVGIGVDSLSQVRNFADSVHLPFPVTHLDGKWLELFKVQFVPNVMVVDSDGRIMATRMGPIPAGPALDSLLTVIRGDGASAPTVAARGQ